MFHNTVLSPFSYFYALGNTPAVSLTQDLTPEQDADVLLLGCGDARNVLFTCYSDKERKIDFTCCDIEAGVHARNILLYSLIVDDTDGSKLSQIWNIYYHWKVDPSSVELLSHQAGLLLGHSSSIEAWQDSRYGSYIKFCDVRSLQQVRSYWQGYVAGTDADERKKRESEMQANLDRARGIRKDRTGANWIAMTGVRSAAPSGTKALRDVNDVAKQWWEQGTTSGRKTEAKATVLNPTFLFSPNQGLTLHYGTEPLLGFPLATAYAPLKKSTPFYLGDAPSSAQKIADMFSGPSSATWLVDTAREQFRLWVSAFQKSVAAGCIIRVFVGDALSFSASLIQADQGHANIYCDNWTGSPLNLVSQQYGPSKGDGPAPTRFDVIDTSNLLDHLGSLNMMTLNAGLLKPQPTSCLYTEVLIHSSATMTERLKGLFGIEPRFLALLMDLLPVEMYTNATFNSEDDSILDQMAKQLNTDDAKEALGQVRSRLRWRKAVVAEQSTSRESMQVGSEEVTKLIVALYNHMFRGEDVMSMMMSAMLSPQETINSSSSAYYNKASFAILLNAIRSRISTDWNQAILDSYKWFRTRTQGLTQLYAQELGLYLHLLGLEKDHFPLLDLQTVNKLPLTSSLFKSWRGEIPNQLCVTISVPRKRLSFLKKRTLNDIGIPILACSISGKSKTIGGWTNHFSAAQVCFGKINSQEGGDELHGGGSDIDGGSGAASESSVEVEEDVRGWWGTEDMLVSVLVPTYILIQESVGVPEVHCDLVPTPQASTSYTQDLGDDLHIFSTKLTSKDVLVSRYMPGMTGLPELDLVAKGPAASEHGTTIRLLDDGSGVETLTRRLDVSGDAQTKLANRSSAVKVGFEDPLSAVIIIEGAKPFTLTFPAPVAEAKKKIRIARKSSYVEIEAPLLNPLQEGTSFLLPASLHTAKTGPVPTLWNASRIDLDSFPALSTDNAEKLSWLTSHGSMTFSTRERRLREANLSGKAPSGSKNTHVGLRTEIKDGIFAMFVQFAGVQGQKAKIFALSLESTGIQTLIIPSCLRLDLINHAAVLDAAVIPCTHAMTNDYRLLSTIQTLGNQGLGIMQIKVSELELQCWKGMLPAMVERCRTWSHDGPKCEYAKAGTVPLPKGVKQEGKELLCSCGVGKFPPGYLDDLKGDVKPSEIAYLLEHHATRAAIGLVFPVPYIEDCFLEGLSLDELKERCAKCGSEKRKESAGAAAGGAETLLSCSRCKKEKYCSVDCQRADWKQHKARCAKS